MGNEWWNEQFQMRTKVKDFTVGFILVFLLAGVPYLWNSNFFTETPYHVTDVEHKITPDGGYIKLKAKFTKSGCRYDKLEVFGRYFGDWFLVPWKNTRDFAPEGDRLEGEHTLRIDVGPLDFPFELVQVRTRHTCENLFGVEKVIDKVFATLPLTHLPSL